MTVSPCLNANADVGTNSRVTAGPSLPSVNILFVWDFDWTIVNCNSDEYVPASFLGAAEMERRLRQMIEIHGPTKWHDCVASLINECMKENNSTKMFPFQFT